jgi:polar amino acid transport system substrate-binding protein
MRKLLLILLLLASSAFCRHAGAEVVMVYTSANFAPLVIGDGGVYADLVAYLNRQKLPGLSFKLIYLPRKRLQLMVEEERLDGIVIGMMPHWFNDTAQQKFLWTVPFATDRFVVVSRTGSGMNPNTAGSLSGRSVGLVLGYVYPDLDDWIARQGLVRADAAGEEINLEKLRLGRVDCVAVAESVARFYMKTHAIGGTFTLDELPARQTERRFLVPHAKAAVFAKLAPAIRKLKDDPAWQRIAAKYQ